METNKAFYEIVRETSKYNKYIKWFVRTYKEDMTLISSCGYTTRREAEDRTREMIEIGKQGFPIGGHLSFTNYARIGA